MRLLIFIYLLSVARAVPTSAPASGSGIIRQDLKRCAKNELYYAPMKVGGSALDSYDLLLVTSSSRTWINYNYATRAKIFDSVIGTNTKKVRWYGSGIKADLPLVYSTKLEFSDGTLVERQAISGVWTELSDQFYQLRVDGFLGLGYTNFDESDYKTLVERLFIQGNIGYNLFSLYLERESVADEVAGKLILGGIDPTLYSGEIHYLPLYENGLLPTSVSLDWSRAEQRVSDDMSPNLEVNLQENSLVLDSSSVYHNGPASIMNKLHLDGMGAKLLASKNYYVFDDCRLDNKPDFVFKFEKFSISVKPEDYVIKLVDDGREICISGFRPTKGCWFGLGTRFLRNHYLVFDYENQRIGFANPK